MVSFHFDCTHKCFQGTLISIHFSFENLKFFVALDLQKGTSMLKEENHY